MITYDTIPTALQEILDRLERIENKHSNPENGKVDDSWMTVEQLIQYLPGNPTKKTIYRKVSNRQIPHSKEFGRLSFRKSEIDEWLRNKKRKTVSEVNAEAGGNLKPRKKS